MSLHEDLRLQAWRLAKLEPRRPRQASLRRAVSTAYYALFHLLVADATRAMLGSQRERRDYRHLIARGFGHRSMMLACRSFGSGTLPERMRTVLGPGAAIPPGLGQVARTFVLLQEQRHRADYNAAIVFSRGQVLDLLQETDAAFQVWRQVRSDPMARFFLMSLPLWEQLRG
jgi:uncharacterized protein (UPF0332 family)